MRVRVGMSTLPLAIDGAALPMAESAAVAATEAKRFEDLERRTSPSTSQAGSSKPRHPNAAAI